MVFKNLADNSRVLDLQYRYETGYDRQFCRAYAFFLKLRAKPDTQLEDTEFQSAQFSSAIATWEPAPENWPAPAREGEGASEPREAFDDLQEIQSENRPPACRPHPAKPLKPQSLVPHTPFCETDPIHRRPNPSAAVLSQKPSPKRSQKR